MITFFSRKPTSSLALAIALATGSMVATTAFAPVEVSAKKKKKKDDETGGGGYSKEFREVYTPLDELLKEEGADLSASRAQIDALGGLLNTNDEKYAGGFVLFNSGIKLEDRELQLTGMQSVIESGLAPADRVGRFNFIAYQTSNQLGKKDLARTYLQAAIDNNFTTATVNPATMRIAMMELLFSTGDYDAGYSFLRDAVSTQKSQGLGVDETWYKRGVAVAYENEVTPMIYEIASMWLADYPTDANWRDAVNIARNLNDFEPAEMLDLFRLARAAGSLSDASDYDYYVEVADARRLPSEVKAVIEEGKAAGVLLESNLFISEALGIANGRIGADRADLPALERDASAPGAGLRTIVAAGDAFLSYGEYSKAANFYERSLTMPAVKLNEELNRLAIAQVGMGDYAAARATLKRITGRRMPIALLWLAYANQLDNASAAAPAVQPSSAPATAGVSE